MPAFLLLRTPEAGIFHLLVKANPNPAATVLFHDKIEGYQSEHFVISLFKPLEARVSAPISTITTRSGIMKFAQGLPKDLPGSVVCAH